MKDLPSLSEALWEQQQLAVSEQNRRERREWLEYFVLMFALIVATLTVAMLLACRPASL